MPNYGRTGQMNYSCSVSYTNVDQSNWNWTPASGLPGGPAAPEGCTDSNACNYTVNATVDTGICEFPPDSCDYYPSRKGCFELTNIYKPFKEIVSEGTYPASSVISVDNINEKVYWGTKNASGILPEDFEQAQSDPLDGAASLMYNGNFSSSGDWANGAQPYAGDSALGTIGDPYAFLRRSGSTTSGGTGPDGAQSGIAYVYTEASTSGNKQNPGAPTKYFVLSRSLGESLNISEMSFWYHMYGADMDDDPTELAFLNVSASSNGVSWASVDMVADATGGSPFVTSSLVGQQQASSADPWKKATVDLSSYLGGDLWVKIVARTGDGYRSDIALDNIQFEGGGGYVYRSDLNGENLETLVSGSSRIDSVMAWPESGKFYWADDTAKVLKYAEIDTPSVSGTLTSSIDVIEMDYNDAMGLIYFVGSGSLSGTQDMYVVTASTGESNPLIDTAVLSAFGVSYNKKNKKIYFPYYSLLGLYGVWACDWNGLTNQQVVSGLPIASSSWIPFNAEVDIANDMVYTLYRSGALDDTKIGIGILDANAGAGGPSTTITSSPEPVALYPETGTITDPPLSLSLQTYCTSSIYFDIGALNVADAELKTIFYTDGDDNELVYRTKTGTDSWGSATSILSTTDSANGIGVDYYNKKIYFTRYEPNPGLIQSCSFDGSDYGTVLETGSSINDERGIAVCPRLGKIFWVLRATKNEIHSASLDGSNAGIILNNTQVDDPYDIVVDQENEKLYYVCASARTGSLVAFSASIDGTNHGPLASELQTLLLQDEQDYHTIGVDIDRVNQKLYFAGQHGPSGAPDTRIHRSDTDGSNASLIVSDQRADSYHPIDIQVDPWGDRIYYCYNDSPDLMISCSLSNPGTGSENLSGIAFTCDNSGTGGSFLKFSMNFEGREECLRPTRFSGSTIYIPDGNANKVLKTFSPLKSIGTNSDPDRT
jgi:hypothetical protein